MPENAPSEDRKCWQRIELGIHGLKSWGRNWARKVRETRSSGGLQGHEGGRTTHFRASGKRDWPPTSPWPRFSRSTHRPMPPAGNWLCFACSIPPLFVLSHSLPMVNTMGKLALFWHFSITVVSASSISLATGHCSRATDHHSPHATSSSSLATVLPPSASPAGSGRAQTLPYRLLPSTAGLATTERGPISTIGPSLYYPGTEEAHTNPTRQRGECLRALAGASG